jgi:hypothetical protein
MCTELGPVANRKFELYQNAYGLFMFWAQRKNTIHAEFRNIKDDAQKYYGFIKIHGQRSRLERFGLRQVREGGYSGLEDGI